jgi:hypothetical protein
MVEAVTLHRRPSPVISGNAKILSSLIATVGALSDHGPFHYRLRTITTNYAAIVATKTGKSRAAALASSPFDQLASCQWQSRFRDINSRVRKNELHSYEVSALRCLRRPESLE